MQIKISPEKVVGRGPCVLMYGPWVTKKVWEEVAALLAANNITTPEYTARQKASAFFQGGSDQPNGQFILIEFWAPEERTSDFMELLNKAVAGTVEEHRTQINIVLKREDAEKRKDLIETALTINVETDCTVDFNINNASVTFSPVDNVQYSRVLMLMKPYFDTGDFLQLKYSN